MQSPPQNAGAPGPKPGERYEPYVRLVRSLLPEASSVAMFGPTGEPLWSTASEPDPELINAVDDAQLSARSHESGGGQLRMLGGGERVAYLCWLRDEAQQLLAILAVVCLPPDAKEQGTTEFSSVHSTLAPAIECLRRELIARSAIDELNATVSGLDKDLNLLLAHGGGELAGPIVDGSNELQLLLQQTSEHLHACTGALLVPEKSVTLVCSGTSRAPDTQFLLRAHKSLLLLAHGQREPLVLNETLCASNPDAFEYRVLCCALRSRAGRSVGVLALLRDAEEEPFSERDAHIAEILARKAISVIESSYDALSGLYTRSAFERRVRNVVSERQVTQPWSALYIDVDQLHAINEKSGMHVGDAVLGHLGELVRQRLPLGGFGARISGDRFVVMLPAEVADAERFAESLREGAEQLALTEGESRLSVSISVGVAPVDVAAEELAHVLAEAEAACKAAKDRGRNRVEVYEQTDVSIVRRFADIGIMRQLREAIDDGRLHLDAQLILPFAAAETARPHYELLLRMTDDSGRTVGPDSFLSAATRYQLMPEIDRWVISHVIEALQPRARLLQSRAIGFAINFSGQSLHDEGFAELLLGRISGSGLDPGLFCFELTENATVANLPRAAELMQRLRRAGCGVALDDFGTGLSSLACLRQLPVTMLKIDGSFVRDVLKDPRAESMVRAIAQLARSMSILTVAEYVETEAIAARIVELGVDYGQGFAIGKPIPLADLLLELPLSGTAAEAGESARSGTVPGQDEMTWYLGAAG